MANCYANLITIKGSQEEINRTYRLLKDDFDLSDYYNEFMTPDLEDSINNRLNDKGYLETKSSNCLRYYFWTKWRPFEPNMILKYHEDEDTYDAILTLPDFTGWLGIKDLELLYYPAEDIEDAEGGFNNPHTIRWKFDEMDWEINWHIHTYNYIFELELKLKWMIKYHNKFLDKLFINYMGSSDDRHINEQDELIKKFSQMCKHNEFVTENQDALRYLADAAEKRIIEPPVSFHNGSGSVEKKVEIEAFKRKYNIP